MKMHALIIGGTRGIGRALVKVLAETGYIVSVIGRRLAADRAPISNVDYWTADLLDQDRLTSVLAEIIDQNGKLNYLIFLQRYRGEGDDWSGEIKITLNATKYIIEHVVDQFDGFGDNSIVMVSSTAARFVIDSQALGYHVAKAGLDQMIRYYALRLGPRGIRVNGVSPCTVMKEETKDFYLKNEALLKMYQAITPLGRMGTAKEVAEGIAFLCSPGASFITGQNITIDGGMSLIWPESLARQLLAGQ